MPFNSYIHYINFRNTYVEEILVSLLIGTDVYNIKSIVFMQVPVCVTLTHLKNDLIKILKTM
jgi:hypothetical protein